MELRVRIFKGIFESVHSGRLSSGSGSVSEFFVLGMETGLCLIGLGVFEGVFVGVRAPVGVFVGIRPPVGVLGSLGVMGVLGDVGMYFL